MRFIRYRRSSWHGLLARLVIALIVAVALDFVVAYGCARWSPRRESAADITGFKDEPPIEGIEFEPMRSGWSRFAMVEYGPGFEYYAVLAISDRKRQTTTGFGHGKRLEAGWPFRSWLVVVDKPPIPRASPDYRGWFWSDSSIFATPNGTLTRLRPLFPGSLANMAIAFPILSAFLLAPVAVRASVWRHRQRSGRCVQCGYPVEAHATCPECGNRQPGR